SSTADTALAYAMIVDAICSRRGSVPTVPVIYWGKNKVTMFALKIVFAKSNSAHARIGRVRYSRFGLRDCSFRTNTSLFFPLYQTAVVAYAYGSLRRADCRLHWRMAGSGASFPIVGSKTTPFLIIGWENDDKTQLSSNNKPCPG